MLLVWIAASSCGESPQTSSGDADLGDSEATTSGDPDLGDSSENTAPSPSGPIALDACLGQTGIAERCILMTNASACTQSRCSKLVVVFSGGEMGCVTGPGYASVLAGYAAQGYAAVCVNYFETSAGSGSAPYVDEAGRIDIAVREATRGAWARTYWTGEDLLFEGISHGATAPVILMARTTLDDQPHWHGSRHTGACFFDGAYDQVATASLLATGALGGKACTTPVSYTRWLERYCGEGATAEACDLSTNPKAQEETLTSASADSFSIRDYLMFECGSALRPCTGDIVAGAPIQTLCERIDASPEHTCAFGGLPNDGHLTCHADHYAKCHRWFETRHSP
jgi:hypothetical protein